MAARKFIDPKTFINDLYHESLAHRLTWHLGEGSDPQRLRRFSWGDHARLWIDPWACSIFGTCDGLIAANLFTADDFPVAPKRVSWTWEKHDDDYCRRMRRGYWHIKLMAHGVFRASLHLDGWRFERELTLEEHRRSTAALNIGLPGAGEAAFTAFMAGASNAAGLDIATLRKETRALYKPGSEPAA